MVTLLDIFNQFGLESKLSDGLNQLELGEHLVIKSMSIGKENYRNHTFKKFLSLLLI